MEDKKIKIVAYCDSPTAATGFGTVSRNILSGLYSTGKYEINILGINYWGNPHNYPFKIWPVGFNPDNDPYGRKKICKMIPQMDFDILFFLQDTFILDFLPELTKYLNSINKKYASIVYYPIDGIPKKEWIENISVCDYPVAYADFAKKASKEAFGKDLPNEIGVIPHGVNTKEFFYIEDRGKVNAFRQQYWNKNQDTFIITNLNRNQRRKDIPRTIASFVEFRKKVPNSLLYLHMAKIDQGWDLTKVCESYGLDIHQDVLFPDNFGPNQGFPREVVNFIYNSSDCVVSTTLGEGFGLSWIEAMATKTPVIMPNNTAMADFITEDTGYLINSGSDNNLFTVLTQDNEVIRPMSDVDNLSEVLYKVYNNKEETNRRVENAYRWVNTKMDWQKHIVPRWIALFDKAYKNLQSSTGIDPKSKEYKRTIKSEIF